MFGMHALMMDGRLAAFLDPAPLSPGGWFDRPEIAYPLGLCLLALAAMLVIRMPELLSWNRARQGGTLTPIDLQQLMHGVPPVIIDLRRPVDYHGPRGHLRGSHNLTPRELAGRIREVAPDRRALVVLVDRTDRLSHRTAGLLKKEGYQWVRVLKGGMRAWTGRNMPGAVSRQEHPR